MQTCAVPSYAGAAVVRYSWHVGGSIMSKEEVRGGPGSSHLLLRRHHDMGGLPAGAVELGEHAYAPWEKRVGALPRLLRDRPEERRVGTAGVHTSRSRWLTHHKKKKNN